MRLEQARRAMKPVLASADVLLAAESALRKVAVGKSGRRPNNLSLIASGLPAAEMAARRAESSAADEMGATLPRRRRVKMRTLLQVKEMSACWLR